MSSILKAIRKVEEEKRNADHVVPDLSVDQGLTPKKTRLALPLLSGIVLGAVVVAVGFYWMQHKTLSTVSLPSAPVKQKASVVKQEKPIRQTVSPQNDAPSIALPAEEKIAPVKSTLATPVVKEVDVDSPAKNQVVPVKPENSQAPGIKPGMDLSGAKKAVTHDSVAAPKTIKPDVVAAQTADPKLSPHPSLHVSEVFYQDDPANRMAVVNDLPVMVGTQVDKAVVLDIHPDHVLFLFNEHEVRVPLTAP